MNIKDLQKHYDKLNTKERFTLIVAAGVRNDDRDRAALLQSAPRKAFSFPNTYGLSSAFEWLSMWHIMNQLGYAASLYYLLFNGEIESDGSGILQDAPIEEIQRRILEGREAWRAICQDYSIDPDKMLEALPFVEVIELAELTVTAAAKIKPIELTDLQSVIDGYREVIEAKRKEWE